MKTVAVVQARAGSARLPNKVLTDICGEPALGHVLFRLALAQTVDAIIVACPDGSRDDAVAELARKAGSGVFRGSELDVLGRFYGAAVDAEASHVVRVTGDCPLIDPGVVDEVVGEYFRSAAAYASNINPPSFPDGLDVEVFSIEALEEAADNASDPYDREHVTPFIRRQAGAAIASVQARADYSQIRWTLDEPEDLDVLRAVFENFAPRRDFAWEEVLQMQERRPELFQSNATLDRNEGAVLNTGQKLWRRAKRVIPGGGMLLSKRPEMFLPGAWPAYFSKASGCQVWDLDSRVFTDMSLMGVGTNILGYGHPEVDDAVMRTVQAGNMSTLNCPEEVDLAEKLVALHPWSDMARLARTGGEANAIAVRIARTASGRDGIAVCGYHGWHDWYLAANLGSRDSLAGHLLPGLAPAGVPRGLRGTVRPFAYNDLDQLRDLLVSDEIGTIKMEVSRSTPPASGFLEGVRELAFNHGAILIFDECTSGFRQAFGGLHLIYGVDPDMAIFSKAMGNGYAISAVIGRRAVMERAQDTFISSTFWTERIGPTAALKTLEVMERERSWEQITHTGRVITERWQRLADKHKLDLVTAGLPALTGFSFASPHAAQYKTLISQELLKRGFLAATSVYVSVSHTETIVDHYFEHLEPVFALISECEAGHPIEELLEGPVCHSGFARLA